tara:strand:- start:4388 stop:6094 length:1707 start_codon:yes stop_codon:yes gene_type:complete
MAEDQRDKNVDSALSIIDTQQKIVGQALVGASGATLAEKQEESYEVLEHLRQLGSKSLKGIQSVANTLIGMFKFDQDEARRRRDQASELKKEQQDKISSEENPNVPGQTDSESKKDGAGLGAMAFLGNFLGRIPGVGAIKKLLAPILGFFGKSGVLFKLFGRFGPFAALTLAIGFVIRYTDEIAKALAPVVDGAKAVIKALQPLLTALMSVVDVVVKSALVNIGAGLKVAFAGLVMAAETFMASLYFIMDLVKGIFTGDIDLIKKAFSDLMEAFNGIGEKFLNAIGDAFKGLINGIGEIFGFENLFATVSEIFNNFITNIQEKFLSFWDSVGNFFNNAIDFVMGIPKMISDTITNAVSVIGEFLSALPGKILNSVKSLFSPIMDFFSSIGIAIKQAINGIIDALPMPQFLKDKIKFDIPVKEEDVAKEINAETPDNVIDVMPKPKVKDGVIVDENNEPIVYRRFDFAKAAAKVQNITNDGDFEAKSLGRGRGFIVKSYSEDLKPNVDITKNVRANPKELGATDTSMAPVVITRGGDTVTNSNVAKTDYHNSPLNVNVDNYHDRMSIAT